MPTRLLFPLNCLLSLLALILCAWSFWPGVSKAYSGAFSALICCCVLGSMVCSAYAPGKGPLHSPRRRKWLLAGLALFGVLAIQSVTISLGHARRERERASALGALRRDMNRLQTALSRFDSKRPTRAELDRLEAQLREINAQNARLKQIKP